MNDKQIFEELGKSIIETIPDYVLFLDQELKIQYINRLEPGTRMEDVIGVPLYTLANQGNRQLTKEKLESVLATEKNLTYETEYERPDGSTVIFENIASPVYMSEKVFGVTVICRNITKRRQAELAVRKSADRFQTFFDKAPIGYQSLDENGCFLEVNQTWLDTLGYTKDEVIGKSFGDFLHPDWQFHFKEHFPRFKAIGEILGVEFEMVRKDGSTVLMSINGRIGKNPDGSFKQTHCVLLDISGQRRAEEQTVNLENQLRQAQKMEAIGTLAGGIAHDFNNILSVILGYSEIILDGLPADSHLAEDIKIIIESGKKASSLTNQLLAFSRKQVLEMRRVDLNSTIENMAKMFGRIIGEDIDLQLNIKRPTKRVLADPAQIEQILMNLVVNARDAMPDGGSLIIETEEIVFESDIISHHKELKPGCYTMVAISDNGDGMTREVQKKIFEPFFTTKEKSKGTGLGLATVYGIVKQHNGYIYVYSEEGEGTTFKIYLPVAEGDPDQIGMQVTQRKPKGNETVLVVEDDEAIRQLIGKILNPLGYKVLEATNGQEALSISSAYKGDIDLLLTDVIMPGMNGRALADKLKILRPTVKVIFISGYTENVIAQHGVLEPGVSLIQKPISTHKLAEKIREALDPE